MTEIKFDQPSAGIVQSDTEIALKVNSFGTNPGTAGVWSQNNSNSNAALVGINNGEAVGVWGESDRGEGVRGVSHGDNHAAVVAEAQGNAPGLHAKGKRLAGLFEGDVEVTGDVRMLGADCAEEFDTSCSEIIEPGTVMVLNSVGTLEQSQSPYDKKVAGVVSGAGNYKPALILDKKETISEENRLPIALIGKVYCKVDATYSSIEIGDLLTTSTRKGHAMKAEDPYKAFGSVIGKALGPLNDGTGMIPVLVALQ